jgi:multidrug resistance efflux pump
MFLLGLLAAMLVVYLNWSYARAHAGRAQVTIANYVVGTEYAGVITKQYVAPGSEVKAGTPLFNLKSDELTEQLGSGHVTPARLSHPLSEDGQMIITAAKAGIVHKVDPLQGSFVPAGRQLATVADTSTWGVTADFTLHKSALGRLTTSTPLEITLPSGQRVTGRIVSIVQSTKNDRQVTTVQASITPDADSGLVLAGTQVDASLVLDQTTYYSRLLSLTENWLSRWL